MHRRAFLGGSATATAALVAGCSAITGGGAGGDESYHSVTRWALAPSGREQSLTNYTVESVDPAAALAGRDGLDAETLPATDGNSVLWRELPTGDLQRLIEVDSEHRMQPDHYRIFEGDFDVETVTDAFEAATNYEAENVGAHRDVEFYDGGAGSFLHGLTDGRAIEIGRLRGNDPDLSEIERVVDAGTGDVDRITDRHEGVATIADRLEPRHFSTLGTENPDREAEPANGTFRGVTAYGASATVRSTETRIRMILAFRDEAALEAAETEQWVAEARNQSGYSEFSVQTTGRLLTAELAASAGELFRTDGG